MAEQPTYLCGWCGGTEVTTSREGCWGSIIHIICSCCHHEWDGVLSEETERGANEKETR